MNEIQTNETLKDLIDRGVAIREKRIAEEQARLLAIQELREREWKDNARAILELIPPALAEFAHVDVFSEHAYVRISSPFPRVGSVKIYAQREKRGQWTLCSYEATNPDGYYLKFPTLEEALAYAAGVLRV
jgi:hypothetical protein